MIQIFTQLVGWIGTVLLVAAYFLVSYNKISSSDSRYQLMNLVGAIGVGANVFYQQAWPAFAMQIIWGIIAVIALIKSRNI